MSSPRGPRRSVPESTRVVLREITAAAHNSPPMQSSCLQSGNDSSLQKTSEYEVKVRFAREFADVGSIGYNTVPESLSSSSSFQSLSSTRSTKSSSGICSDSVPQSIDQILDTSYLNSSIPDVEDLILRCSNIKLESENPHEISHDQTFISATDETIPDFTESLGSNDSLLADSCTQAIETSSCSVNNRTQDLPDRPVVVIPLTQTEEPSEKSISPSGNDDLTASSQTCSFDVVEELPLPSHSTEGSNLNTTTCLSPDKVNPDAPTIEDQQIIVQDIQAQVVVDDYQDQVVVDNYQDQVVVEDFQAQVEVEDFQAQAVVEDFQAQAVVEDFQAQAVVEDFQAQAVVEDFKAQAVVEDFQDQAVVEDFQDQTESIALNIVPYPVTDSVSSVSAFAENTEDLSLPSISILPSLQLTDSSRICGKETRVNDSTISVTEISKNVLNSFAQETDDKSSNPLATFSPDFCDAAISRESCTNLLLLSETSSAISRSERVEERLEANAPAETEDDINIKVEVEAVLDNTDATESLTETEDEKGEQSSEETLGSTSIVKDELLKQETAPEEEHYKDFKPQRQSTTLVLPNIEQTNLEELKSSAEEVANDIFKSTIDFPEESDYFTTATSNIFQDPTSFDFLINHGNSRTRNRLRADSLYVKFDPLVGDTSNMLLQENTDPINEEEQNGKTESPPPSIVTPKRNPAIAAIDRLLFYSPITTGMTLKMEEPKEKNEQAADEPKSETPFINDINMSKELELVRATVLQLEEELEKQKKEHKAELERQKNSFQEKINQLQTQLAQEVKSKSEITVVVEEYEKSISRLLTEKGRDQEELQATNVHLSNTEAAFNDVHQKYEKMKSVVSVYKNNEIVLRESIQENMQTIKCLHTRYDNLKAHALSQLEKANSDLENIRKQHEDEIVTLHALVRKAELKSNSLSELVEQKTKENKELVQILDEVIARVGHPTTE